MRISSPHPFLKEHMSLKDVWSEIYTEIKSDKLSRYLIAALIFAGVIVGIAYIATLFL
jgi:hypothetical protein